MSTKTDLGGAKETLVKSMLGRGRFTKGEWYCEFDKKRGASRQRNAALVGERDVCYLSPVTQPGKS